VIARLDYDDFVLNYAAYELARIEFRYKLHKEKLTNNPQGALFLKEIEGL
jgi:hypothetical protein